MRGQGPDRRAFLKASKLGADAAVEYRDSFEKPSENAKQAATRALRKLGAIGPAEERPPSNNKSFQVDGWPCGLWATRWVERALREIRGEGRRAPVSVILARARGSDFIRRLQGASDNPAAKAKDEAKGKRDEGPLAAAPAHATSEEALEAAGACAEPLVNKGGPKGRRACVGAHFEEVRKRGFLARAAKDAEAPDEKNS